MVSQARTDPSGVLTRAMTTVCAALVLLALPTQGAAQYFGRNKVQYDNFDFKILKTPHFNIHFYPEEATAVEDAARMSERWYERFARLFQHEFEKPKPIILYADHPDFQQTNTLRGSVSEGLGGVTESLKNRVILPLTGSYWDTDHVLGHELVHAFQYNIAQARSGAGIRGLTLLPLWLVEGLAEYLSVGREDPLTAMWMRDAILRNDVPTLRQMTSERRFFPYRFGQAFWAYVGGTYGDEAVVDLYRRAVRVGWEPALGQVLGMSSDTLSLRWREAVEAEYLPLMAGKQAPGESGTLLLAPETGAGRQNLAPSVSPDGRFVAFLSEKDLFGIDLFIADARTGEIIRKLVSANSDPHFDALRFIDSAGDWSPDGSKFVFIVFAEGDNELAIVNTENGEIERKISIDGVGALTNPAWSPDGRYIAFSGMEGGVSDIYIWDVNTGALRQMTDDKNADLQPTWSPDGRTIAFVSDRGPNTDFSVLKYSKPRVAFLDVQTRAVQVLDVFGDVKHINPQYAPDGRSLYFVSDQDGFSDIYQYAFDTGEVRRITQLVTGVSGITYMSPAFSVAEEAGTIVYTVFDEFEFHIYSLDANEANAGGVSVAATAEPKPGRILPPSRVVRSSRIAGYLADPLTGLVPENTYRAEDAVAYDSRLMLDYVGQPSLGVGTDRFGSYIGGGAAAFFSDMLGNRTLGLALQANGRFKDIGGQAFYLNQEKRLNWGVSGQRLPFLTGGFLVRGVDSESGLNFTGVQRNRVFLTNASFITRYPFSTTRRIEAQVGITRWSFDTEVDRFFQDQFGRTIGIDRISLPSAPALNLFEGSIALVGDNSFLGFTSPVGGGRYRLEVGPTLGSINYTNVTVDLRRYFSPNNNITFAARALHLGRYGNDFSSEKAQVIREYYLGFETLVRGYAFESFSFDPSNRASAECLGAQPDPRLKPITGCPNMDRLFGHKVGVVNFEVRVPLFGTSQFGLINFPALPTELVLFSDAGMAWNSFSDINFEVSRRPTGVSPVFSTGASARFNLFGMLILEWYYAIPWQRPERGGHFGFLVSPGW
ncbi:MAG: DPP IV N-terminal domain-containing protein [Gemmatimonadota bacterium]|nr:MAG: DPP IV N-terminal domain-containing protein [Gemmatimonadota bacterium]